MIEMKLLPKLIAIHSKTARRIEYRVDTVSNHYEL